MRPAHSFQHWTRAKSPCHPYRHHQAAFRALLLRLLRHHRLGGDQQAGDRCRVLQRGAHDLGWIDDAGLDEILELAALRVEAPVDSSRSSVLPAITAPSSPAFSAICRSGVWIALRTISMPKRWSSLSALSLARTASARQRHAAAGHDAFLDRRAGRMHRVIDAVLALLHLDLGAAANADHRDAAGQLRQPLLQLLAIVVRGGLLDLRRIWLQRPLMSSFLPAPSTIVVFSFSISIRFALPSMSRVTFSSLMPRSSLIPGRW